MRRLRVLAVGALVAGALAVLAPGAGASVPGVSKTCQSLNTLNQKLGQAIASGDAGKFDSGAISDLSSSFRKAAKTGPKSLRSAMNTIAAVASNVAGAGSTGAAATALTNGGAKLTSALATWGTYLARHCPGSTVSTT